MIGKKIPQREPEHARSGTRVFDRTCAPVRAFVWCAVAVALCVVSCGRESDTQSDQPPPVVLIVLESLRADHLGCYGYSRPTSPVLDAFAAHSIRYANAHAVTSWTLPSHVSILTGTYPAVHGVTEPDQSLADEFETLAERLAGVGIPPAGRPPRYETAAFVSAPFLRRPYNLHQGFAIYDDEAASPTNVEGHADVTNSVIESKVMDYLDSRSGNPFFLYVHLWDIHFDYIPPAPYDTMFVDDACEPFPITELPFNDAVRPGMSDARLRYLISQYDGEIRCADALVGRVFDRLKERGDWENAVVVVTADHGEEFFEHGAKGHKKNLHGTSLRVPLLIKPSGPFEPRVVDEPVSLTMLAGMIDSLADVTSAMDGGRSAGGTPAPVFAALDLNLHALVDGEIVASRVDHHESIEAGGWKLIRLPQKGGVQLFHIAGGDRAELHDTAAAHPKRVRELLSALDARNEAAQARMAVAPAGRIELDEAEKERLRGLGYLGR